MWKENDMGLLGPWCHETFSLGNNAMYRRYFIVFCRLWNPAGAWPKQIVLAGKTILRPWLFQREIQWCVFGLHWRGCRGRGILFSNCSCYSAAKSLIIFVYLTNNQKFCVNASNHIHIWRYFSSCSASTSVLCHVYIDIYGWDVFWDIHTYAVIPHVCVWLHYHLWWYSVEGNTGVCDYCSGTSLVQEQQILDDYQSFSCIPF